MDYKKLSEKFYEKAKEKVSKIENKYKRIACLDLIDRYKEFFSEIRVGAPSLYAGEPILEKNQNLVRVPIMWDHYVFKVMREGRDGYFGEPGEIKPNTNVPDPTNLGCDYLLDLEGKILCEPSIDDIKKRFEIVNNAHPDKLDCYR